MGVIASLFGRKPEWKRKSENQKQLLSQVSKEWHADWLKRIQSTEILRETPDFSEIIRTAQNFREFFDHATDYPEGPEDMTPFIQTFTMIAKHIERYFGILAEEEQPAELFREKIDAFEMRLRQLFNNIHVNIPSQVQEELEAAKNCLVQRRIAREKGVAEYISRAKAGILKAQSNNSLYSLESVFSISPALKYREDAHHSINGSATRIAAALSQLERFIEDLHKKITSYEYTTQYVQSLGKELSLPLKVQEAGPMIDWFESVAAQIQILTKATKDVPIEIDDHYRKTLERSSKVIIETIQKTEKEFARKVQRAYVSFKILHAYDQDNQQEIMKYAPFLEDTRTTLLSPERSSSMTFMHGLGFREVDSLGSWSNNYGFNAIWLTPIDQIRLLNKVLAEGLVASKRGDSPFEGPPLSRAQEVWLFEYSPSSKSYYGFINLVFNVGNRFAVFETDMKTDGKREYAILTPRSVKTNFSIILNSDFKNQFVHPSDGSKMSGREWTAEVALYLEKEGIPYHWS